MKKTSEPDNTIARFECKATAGIGYAYAMRAEYKNLVENTVNDDPKWEDKWHQSDRMGSVSLGFTKYLTLEDVPGIMAGAKVRFYMDVKAGPDRTATEEFIYLPVSRFQATYDGRGSVFNPSIKYNGRSLYREPNHDSYSVGFFRAIVGDLGKWFDHTYCRVGDMYFECHGGVDGGEELSSNGMGDIEFAIQTAQGNIHIEGNKTINDGNAGIIYALTGVCHQIANRILWTAQVNVSGVRGYGLSSTIYGAYGRGRWNPVHLDDLKTPFMAKMNSLFDQMRDGEITEEQLALMSAEVCIDEKLGEGFVDRHPKLIEIIGKAQADVMKLSTDVSHLSEEGKLSVNSIAHDLQKSFAEILSEKEYMCFFGVDKNSIMDLI